MAEKINIYQIRDRSPGCNFQCLESKAPPNTSEHITIGIKNGIGNTHIKRGVIMSAPPKPLSLLIKPPKMPQISVGKSRLGFQESNGLADIMFASNEIANLPTNL